MAGLVASKMRRARDKELKDAKDGDDKESKTKCRNSKSNKLGLSWAKLSSS